MGKPSADRNAVVNQSVFRKANEKVQLGFKRLAAMARAESNDAFVPPQDTPLHFYCECSDENCRERIVMEPKLYDDLHRNRKHFIVLPGHEAESIEKVIKRTEAYRVVEKFDRPPEKPGPLKATEVENV